MVEHFLFAHTAILQEQKGILIFSSHVHLKADYASSRCTSRRVHLSYL